LPDGRSIGHNKFMVYVDAHGHPQAVLSGSTKLDGVGPLYPEHNCIVIRRRSSRSAICSTGNNLKDDTEAAGIPPQAKAVSALQGRHLAHQMR